MRDDLVSRSVVFEALLREYQRRKAWKTGGLQLAWIEKAVDDVAGLEPMTLAKCDQCEHYDREERSCKRFHHECRTLEFCTHMSRKPNADEHAEMMVWR